MLQQHKYFFADVKNLPKTLTQVNVADTPIILNYCLFIDLARMIHKPLTQR